MRAGTIAIVGGGCYGSFYAGQLARAAARGRLEAGAVLVVDRDSGCQAAREPLPEHGVRRLVEATWESFLPAWLAGEATASDWLVPSPLMPHLLADWLAGVARAAAPGRTIESAPLPRTLGTPFDTLAPDGRRYVSFADWLCPTHCIEPLTCPMIRGPRTWEMSDAVRDYAGVLGPPCDPDPILLVTRHLVHGVGAISVASLLEAAARVRRAASAPGPADLLVGSISSCHGALGLLRLAAATPGTR